MPSHPDMAGLTGRSPGQSAAHLRQRFRKSAVVAAPGSETARPAVPGHRPRVFPDNVLPSPRCVAGGQRKIITEVRTTLRLDPDLIAAFCVGGPGWKKASTTHRARDNTYFLGELRPTGGRSPPISGGVYSICAALNVSDSSRAAARRSPRSMSMSRSRSSAVALCGDRG